MGSIDTIILNCLCDGDIEPIGWVRAQYKLRDKIIEFSCNKEFVTNMKRGNIKSLIIENFSGEWILTDFRCYIYIH